MSFFGKSRMMQEIMTDYEWEMPTSFIDVVFLLLIFFMCCSSFHTMEQRLDALLPKDKGMQQQQQPITRNLDELVIHVTAKSAEDLGTPKFTILGWTGFNENDLADKLRTTSVKDATDPNAIRPVVIAGKPECPFKHIMSALDACARANLTKVEFRPPMAGEEAGGSTSDHTPL